MRPNNPIEQDGQVCNRPHEWSGHDRAWYGEYCAHLGKDVVVVYDAVYDALADACDAIASWVESVDIDDGNPVAVNDLLSRASGVRNAVRAAAMVAVEEGRTVAEIVGVISETMLDRTRVHP